MLSGDETQHGVREYVDEETRTLPIFLEGNPDHVIGHVEYAVEGGVYFHFLPAFMKTLPPNVKEFRLSAHYKSMLEPPVGISLSYMD